MDPITELEAAIKDARARLKTADADEKNRIEAEIGAKSAELKDLKARDKEPVAAPPAQPEAAPEAQASTSDTLADLRAQVAQGLKSQVADILKQELTTALQEQIAGDGLKSIVSEMLPEVLGSYKTGRKTPVEGGEDSEGRAPLGAPAFIQGGKMGEKGNLTTFVRAIGRKDTSAIGDMQRGTGVELGRGSYTAYNGYGPYVGNGQKALVEGGGWTDTVAGPSGGYVVPVQYVNELIPMLYPYTTVMRAGPRIVPMTSPTLKQGRQTGGATASYVGETAPIPASQPTFGQFSLTAKELVCMVPVSKLLLNDSDPAIEGIVRDDMAREIGLKQDVSFLLGSGTGGVPQGILTAPGTTQIAAVGTNGDAPTYKMITSMLTQIRKNNIPYLRRAWFGPPDLQNALLNVVDGNGRPIFAEYYNPQQQGIFNNGGGNPSNQTQPGPDGMLMGLPFYSSTQIPLGVTGSGLTAGLALVEMSQVMVGELGTMELDAFDQGTYTDGNGNIVSAVQNVEMLFRAVVRHDIGLAHGGACIYRQGVIYS